MIAAVSPTSASSRKGTPAPRSARASSPPARLSAPLTIRKTVLHRPEIELSRSAGETFGVDAEHLGDPLGADRAGSQDARLVRGQVEDGRGGLLGRLAAVEVDVDQVAQLLTGIAGVHGGRATGDVGARDGHRPDLAQQFD